MMQADWQMSDAQAMQAERKRLIAGRAERQGILLWANNLQVCLSFSNLVMQLSTSNFTFILLVGRVTMQGVTVPCMYTYDRSEC